MKILSVVGARPNFMKIGPIMEALRNRSEQEMASGRKGIEQYLVHTGQHYDRGLSELFFEQLALPAPDVNLEVGSGSHAAQTAEIMRRFERVCQEQQPSHVLVVGDVNSTIACALVAAKLGVKVVHVEAGLRSFDRRMPEEINRILTDAISDILFTTEESANDNLKREGIPAERVHFVGNVMIDTLLKNRGRAEKSPVLERLELADSRQQVIPYGVLTLHRPGSVDNPVVLGEVIEALTLISNEFPIIFPVHPRTKSMVDAFGFHDFFSWDDHGSCHAAGGTSRIYAIEPLGYLDFLRLMSCAQVVLTDSGGIQEETTILGIPCVTLRDSTERPITTTRGTNVLAGMQCERIIAETHSQLKRASAETWRIHVEGCRRPPLWDGRAAERIVDVLVGG